MGQADSVSPDGPITAMEFEALTPAIVEGWLVVRVTRITISKAFKTSPELPAQHTEIDIEPPDGKEILLAVPASNTGPALGEQPKGTLSIDDLATNLTAPLRELV